MTDKGEEKGVGGYMGKLFYVIEEITSVISVISVISCKYYGHKKTKTC